MSKETPLPGLAELAPRQQRAVTELAQVIQAHVPGATFRLRAGIDDPEATYLVTTVDIDDPDVVLDLVAERLLQLQVEEGVPVHVLPIHPPKRVAQTMERVRRQTRGEALLPHAGSPSP
jgi:hypothetical protein